MKYWFSKGYLSVFVVFICAGPSTVIGQECNNLRIESYAEGTNLGFAVQNCYEALIEKCNPFKIRPGTMKILDYTPDWGNPENDEVICEAFCICKPPVAAKVDKEFDPVEKK
jgi:hypothetical protein